MIIGISGPTGSGKDTAANFIDKEFGFKHVSGGDALRDMLRKIGFEPKKEAVGDLGTLLRNNYGADAILKIVLASVDSPNVIASGFRSPEEAKVIQGMGGIVIYIDAPENIRHDRVVSRSRENENHEQIKAIEKKEAHSENKLGESLIDVRALADVIIANNGSIEQLYDQLRKVVLKYIAIE